jgi:hypothetical protein
MQINESKINEISPTKTLFKLGLTSLKLQQKITRKTLKSNIFLCQNSLLSPKGSIKAQIYIIFMHETAKKFSEALSQAKVVWHYTSQVLTP